MMKVYFPGRMTAQVAAGLLLIFPQASAQISAKDDLGRTIVLFSPARRVVSLAPSITETLFAIGAGDQICGVTDQCTFPGAARGKLHVGGMTNPNIEAIVGLRPDLIVMSMEGNTRAEFAKLTSLGVTIFVTNPRTLRGIQRSIEQLGILTGHTSRAAQIDSALRARQDSVDRQSGSRRVRALLLISIDPLIAAGKDTFINDLIVHAGGENIAATASGSYPALSREAVLASNPEVIVFTADLSPDLSTLITHFPEWSRLDAVQGGRVYRIDPDIISRPGPRAVEGLEQLSQFFHAINK